MSDLHKKQMKARFNQAMHSVMPPPPLPDFNELDEDRHSYNSASVPNTPQDDDSSSASSVSSTGTVIPSPGRALFARPQGFPGGRSFEPIPWTAYFERELFLPAPDGSITYHAYLTSPAPPAGPGRGPGPLFVTHHGAGSSGLSFAVLATEIRKRLPTAGILSLDARGHGLTTTTSSTSPATDSSDGEREGERGEDLSLPTLAADLLALLTLTKSAMAWPSLPPLILVGHSLGGAVVTEFASRLLPSVLSSFPSSSSTTTRSRPSPPTPAATKSQPLSLPPASLSNPSPPPSNLGPIPAIDLLGYAVLDVVEGSAMDALQSMHAYLATRPAGFESVRDAVEWHVRSRTVRNAVSARVSVPGLLVKREEEEEEEAAAAGVEAGEGEGRGDSELVRSGKEEEGVADGRSVSGGGSSSNTTSIISRSRTEGAHWNSKDGRIGGGRREKPWRWRTDLARTQPFWEGWFRGLSSKFLSGRGGKMLLLAGTDRLDTELTIGQMQGKYALQVFPEAGHFIHEDLPEKTAMALVDFHRRSDRSALVLPPKVSELLAQGKRV